MKHTTGYRWIVLLLWMSSQAVMAAGLNEWTFSNDPSGMTLSEAANSGAEQSVFEAGGAGFLETDGDESLVCIHSDPALTGMWTNGAVLNAEVTSQTSGVRYLRYDVKYDLRHLNKSAGAVLGLGFVDGSGAHVAGFGLGHGAALPPAGRSKVAGAARLAPVGRISVIAEANLDTQMMSVWYDVTGLNHFDEARPYIDNAPINLSSIDALQFQATGDFQPLGSTDYAAVDAILTASTWTEIAGIAEYERSVHPLFCDKMVLQRDVNVPVWGHAIQGKQVIVKLDGETVGTTTAGANGRWMVQIGTHAHDGGLPHILSVSVDGEDDIEINGVVFGDVYLASGQSNMEFSMSRSPITGYTNELEHADEYPLIRQVTVSLNASSIPLEEPVLSAPWVSCSTSTLPKFSATAYFFAKSLYEKTGVPVGLVQASWGGQRIERFLAPSGVAAVPELSGMSQQQESGVLGGFYDIYNAMIAPVIPYAIRGVIWYQGEANANGGNIYQFQMQALLRGWRKDWNIETLPFYYVQLANFGVAANWPDVREAQLRVLSETNCGMAVAIDVGETDNIHPANKIDIGHRLAQWALAKDLHYDIPYSGPLFHRAQVENDQIRVIFDFADHGLMVVQKNSTNAVVQIDSPLENFEIAGADRVFVSAIAILDQNTVLVSSPAVLSPMYVRYCYSGDPSGGNKLYNAEGFPASPFRTDESYRLDVKSGTGTATAVVTGTQVAITATAASAGYVFDRWIGAGAAITDPNAATTTITMPPHALYVSATYRDESDSTFQLTVNNGSGGGAAQAGAIINVEAVEPLPGQQFGYWTGDTQTVENVRAACTTLRMPEQNIQITPVYQVVDSVGDGIPDTWRVIYFGGDGSTTNSHSAANADDDMDGLSNLQEYLTGTSPVDAGSVLALGGQFADGSVMLSFHGGSGRRYQLQMTDSLHNTSWETLCYNISGRDSAVRIKFDLDSVLAKFYRVQLLAD